VLGADFPKAAKARFDHGQPHHDVFAGHDLPSSLHTFWPATKEEAASLRKSDLHRRPGSRG
jgi:hypothetical protein